MRFVRVVLALVFGLAMVGPETHACPIHSAAPAGHQHATTGHQESGTPSGAHCTCPQACCPSGVGLSLPATPVAWSLAAGPVIAVNNDAATPFFLPSRDFLLPFALGPPLSS
jgi:hypothetical protein